jgi:anti-anti-sigma regulatory factor
VRQPATTGGWAMEIQRSTQDGCVVVAFTGSIDLFSVSQVQRALLKDLSDQPFALICDLAGVDTLDPVCATVFSTVANHPVSRWPDTSFLLCGAQPTVAEILGRLQVPHFLRLYADVDEAVGEAMSRPRTSATSCCWPRPRPLRQQPAHSCARSASIGSSPSPTPP